MGKTIPVTPAQVAGAQFLVKQAELGGPAVVDSMRQLARAKRKQKPRRVARTPVARTQVSPEEARQAYDGPSDGWAIITAERVELVREQVEKHGVEVHETYDGVIRSGDRGYDQIQPVESPEAAGTFWRDKQ